VVENQVRMLHNQGRRALGLGFGMMMINDAGNGSHPDIQDQRVILRLEALSVIDESIRHFHLSAVLCRF
jgi:hypothetical protein